MGNKHHLLNEKMDYKKKNTSGDMLYVWIDKKKVQNGT